ncbi:ATP-binding protein [Mesorhizobium sp. M0976]|uniref:AAA family ATPase n=1 Tax=Mesorhizobium sp. M0976 TaxID=2957038 RepID=UPI003336F180
MAKTMLNWFQDEIEVMQPLVSSSDAPLTSLAILGHCDLDEKKRAKTFKNVQSNEQADKYRLRVAEFLGYRLSAVGSPNLTVSGDDASYQPDVIVINDAGTELRHGDALAKVFHTQMDRLTEHSAFPPQVVLKMHLPLAVGGVWEKFRASRHTSRRILVVHANDLRKRTMAILQCPSWDRVVEDVQSAITQTDSKAEELVASCDEMVILFDVEGALIVGGKSKPAALTLICDPMRSEGEIERLLPGDMVGKMNCFLAYLVRNLPSPTDSLANAVKTALLASRLYAENCFTVAGGELHYPNVRELTLTHDKRVAKATPGDDLPYYRQFQPDGNQQVDLLSTAVKALGFQVPEGQSAFEVLAHQIVRKGVEAVIQPLPHARFGKLWTVDRHEIEGLRAIQALIKAYLADASQTKPLSIAVFGPPGSGKSFGVKQLVNANEVPILEFNLSQADETQLPHFFQDIRDINLTGKTPLCFFDEFDSQGRKLLKYFLAPMQDGVFREGSALRPVGRGIFVFAGGTASTIDEFAKVNLETGDDGSANGREREEDAKEKKVPDFISRLSGFINVKGPNPQNVDTQSASDAKKLKELVKLDPAHYLRRAILLRRQIERHLPGIISGVDKEASIDPILLQALVGVTWYLHGARSIELLIRAIAGSRSKTSLVVSDLPIMEQMKLHLDHESFTRLLRKS